MGLSLLIDKAHNTNKDPYLAEITVKQIQMQPSMKMEDGNRSGNGVASSKQVDPLILLTAMEFWIADQLE